VEKEKNEKIKTQEKTEQKMILVVIQSMIKHSIIDLAGDGALEAYSMWARYEGDYRKISFGAAFATFKGGFLRETWKHTKVL